jgi:hypothetical protein
MVMILLYRMIAKEILCKLSRCKIGIGGIGRVSVPLRPDVRSVTLRALPGLRSTQLNGFSQFPDFQKKQTQPSRQPWSLSFAEGLALFRMPSVVTPVAAVGFAFLF